MSLIYNFEKELSSILPDVKKSKIAVALVKFEAFNYIQKTINANSEQSFIIGIDLPTDLEVFEALHKVENIKSRIFLKKNQVFHAKVYIFELKDRSVAYVTSSNLTSAGFSKNLEMTYKIENEDQIKYLTLWFDNLFKTTDEITSEFLLDYSERFKANPELEKANRDRKLSVSDIKNKHSKEVVLELDDDIKIKNNLENQFFNLQNYYAFSGNKPYEESADKERIDVADKFLLLDEEIYPKFKFFGLKNLHRHPNNQNRTSTYILRQALSFHLNKIDAIWLHYGKSTEELRKFKYLTTENSETFIHHIRMQCYLNKDNFGISLFIGKPGGSIWERDYIKENLRNNNKFIDQFLNLMHKLDDSHWIDCNEEVILLNDFKNDNEIVEFMLSDNINSYFSIGKEYDPGDQQISPDNIAETTLREFQILYPIYELFKFPSKNLTM